MDTRLQSTRGSFHAPHGFSTLEMLMAFAIFTLTFTGIILVTFGSQSMLVDTRLNTEALSLAKQMLENASSLARENFDNVVTTPTTQDGSFNKKLTVTPADDDFSKIVTSDVSWQIDM